MALNKILHFVALPLALTTAVLAHGGGAHQAPIRVADDADWMTKHMAGMCAHLP